MQQFMYIMVFANGCFIWYDRSKALNKLYIISRFDIFYMLDHIRFFRTVTYSIRLRG